MLWRRQPGTSGKATVWLDTELPKFYEQWSAVQGARVLATTSNENVQVAAFAATQSSSSSLFVCLNNLLNATATAKITLPTLESGPADYHCSLLQASVTIDGFDGLGWATSTSRFALYTEGHGGMAWYGGVERNSS